MAVTITPAAAAARESLLLHLSTAAGVGGQMVLPCPGDLRYSIALPGGHDQLSCTLTTDSGPGDTPPQLVAGGIIQVVDRRTGAILWWGRLDDPGRADTTGSATAYQVTASGGQSLLDGWRRAYALVDRDLANWVPDASFPSGAAAVGDAAGGSAFAIHTSDWSSDVSSAFLETSIGDGTSVPASSIQQWLYYPAWQNPDAPSSAGIATLLFSHKSNAATTSHQVQMYIDGTDWTSMAQVINQNFTTTQVDLEGHAGVGSWSSGFAKTALLRWIYSGAGKTQSGNLWNRIGNVIVCGVRYIRDGTTWDFATTLPELLSTHVFDDALGRGLNSVLEWDVSVDQPTELIDQAEWWGGISGREILDFVLSYSPQCWWGVFEPGDSGKPKASFKSWLNQPVRYIIPTQAGLSLAGGADDLANQALVIYQAGNGTTASTLVIVSVPALTAAGLTRALTVDVRDRGPISLTTAKALGRSALTQADTYRVNGTVTISEPLYDQVLGRMVQPWEIVPGNPVRLSGVAQIYTRGDERVTNAADTFRLTGTAYDAASNTATLTLDGGGRGLISKIRQVSSVLPTPKPKVGRSK
jgi:hypothetical protein